MKETDNQEGPNDFKRLIDEHFGILIADLSASYSRLGNLKTRWENRAKEGLLPKQSSVGVFDTIEDMLYEHAIKLLVFYVPPFQKSNKTHPNPTRDFEDVIELTDGLENIHKALAITERSFLQRLQGYIPPSGSEAPRSGTVSESGDIHQLFNAADVLCASYWNSIFNDPNKCPWVGLPVFGEYHEFRHWRNFIFAPDYVRLRFTRTWIYFSHEVSHQAINKLMDNEQFAQIYEDLVEIFSRFPVLTHWHSPARYLATETIADILATLISGEQYVLALTDLKYYPSFTVFTRQHLSGRPIQYPLLLRILLCSLAVRLAWGFNKIIETQFEKIPEDRILHQIIHKIRNEDAFAKKKVEALFEKTDDELERLTSKTYQAEMLRNYTSEISVHLQELENITIPNVIESMLKERIVHRLKCFVKSDYYHTGPTRYYYNVDVDKFSEERYYHLMNLDSHSFVKTAEANEIDRLRESRIKSLRSIMLQLEQCQLVDEEPRDIIACLGNLTYKTRKTDEKWNHIALCSLSCQS